jgi:hypothetical protein
MLFCPKLICWFLRQVLPSGSVHFFLATSSHEVSWSHTRTCHSRYIPAWTCNQLVKETFTWQHTTNILVPGRFRNHGRSRRAGVDLRVRPHGHWDRPYFARFVWNWTKIATIWVRIIYNFTYCIASDKHFLWSIFWTNTQSMVIIFFFCAKHQSTAGTSLILQPGMVSERQRNSIGMTACNQLW